MIEEAGRIKRPLKYVWDKEKEIFVSLLNEKEEFRLLQVEGP